MDGLNVQKNMSGHQTSKRPALGSMISFIIGITFVMASLWFLASVVSQLPSSVPSVLLLVWPVVLLIFGFLMLVARGWLSALIGIAALAGIIAMFLTLARNRPSPAEFNTNEATGVILTLA